MGVSSGELSLSAASGEHVAGRHEQAQQVVRQNVLWAVGAGAVPIPLVDVLGITAVQLRLVKQLCGVYALPFDEHAARHIITSFTASLGGVALGGLTASLLKAVPVVGQALGAAGVSATAGAAVQATGTLLIRHFDAGGTLQSLDTARLGGYLRAEFEQAKDRLREIW